MRVLSNPIVFRMLLVLFASGFGLWVAVLLLRRMRRIPSGCNPARGGHTNRLSLNDLWKRH